MAHKMKLTIDGGKGEYPLLDCQYSIYRDVDPTGKPAGGARAAQIQLTKESSDDNTFYEWAIDNATRKNGSIAFSKPNVDDVMKTLKFQNAFVTQYSENCGSGMNMVETITISAQIVAMNDVEIDNEWPEF